MHSVKRLELCVSMWNSACAAGAMHSLKRLGSMFDLVVVTSRQHVIRDSTLRWIDLHFPGIFKEVHFGNHWAMEGTSKPKSQICRWGAGSFVPCRRTAQPPANASTAATGGL